MSVRLMMPARQGGTSQGRRNVPAARSVTTSSQNNQQLIRFNIHTSPSSDDGLVFIWWMYFFVAMPRAGDRIISSKSIIRSDLFVVDAFSSSGLVSTDEGNVRVLVRRCLRHKSMRSAPGCLPRRPACCW